MKGLSVLKSNSLFLKTQFLAIILTIFLGKSRKWRSYGLRSERNFAEPRKVYSRYFKRWGGFKKSYDKYTGKIWRFRIIQRRCFYADIDIIMNQI